MPSNTSSRTERDVSIVELETPHGLAHAHLQLAAAPVGALVLGHGAGGGVTAPDLVTTAETALGLGVSVAHVEQPYRVAGRRSPAPAHQLDTAWVAVVGQLHARIFGGLPLLVGGRSSGARVACRTSDATGAAGVLCLAFPLRPPRRGGQERPSRLHELEAVRVPVLVVQGARDPFGLPPASSMRSVVSVPGDHSLRTARAALCDAVAAWLRELVPR